MTGEINQIITYGLTTATIAKLFIIAWLTGEMVIIVFLFSFGKPRKIIHMTLPGGGNIDNTSRAGSLVVLSLFFLLTAIGLSLCLMAGQWLLTLFTSIEINFYL